MHALLGQIVRHNLYGEGEIQEIINTPEKKQIKVMFPGQSELKIFKYPDSFDKSLSPVSEGLQEKVEADKATIAESLATARKAEIEAKEKHIADIKDGVKTDREFTSQAGRLFIVSQGKTFTEEHAGGYLWAPQDNCFHHTNMLKVHAGDVIFHYVDGKIVAVSEALCDCFTARQPSELYGKGWDNEGYEILVRYQLVKPGLSVAPLIPAVLTMKNGKYSFFKNDGTGNQGYFYELELDIAKLFKSEIMKTPTDPMLTHILSRI